MNRCREYLEAPVPDTRDYPNASLIIQCGRESGHAGVHRHTGDITWSGQ